MPTLSEVGRKKVATGTPFPAAIWDYTYNDQPLSDIEVPLESGRKRDRILELLAVALGLGHYERNVKIEDRKNGVPGKQEAPDFFVTLDNGDIVGIEVTRLTDPARTAEWNLIEKLDAGLAQAIRDDAVLAARYGSVSLSIQLAIRKTERYDSKALLNAILGRLRSKKDEEIRPGHIDYAPQRDEPLLFQHVFSVTLSERHSQWTKITPRIPNDELDAEAALLARLADKRSKSMRAMGARFGACVRCYRRNPIVPTRTKMPAEMLSAPALCYGRTDAVRPFL